MTTADVDGDGDLDVLSTLSTGKRSQDIQGNNGNDILSAGNGRDRIQGLGGNDILYGNNGADTLEGGDGDDLLFGGNGRDLLTGGAGRDRFVVSLNTERDTVTDFTDGVDLLALSGLTVAQVSVVASGGNTLVRAGTTTLVTLTGISPSLITAADFVTI